MEGIKNMNMRPLLYKLCPEEWQKVKINKKINDFKERGNCDKDYFEYDAEASLSELISYAEGKPYLTIMGVGKIRIEFTDFPTGICHKILIKKENTSYFVTFICYKKVVGIDIGKRSVICSSGDKFQLPYIPLSDDRNFSEIRIEWLESVAVQLLLDYDVLFLENLEVDEQTPQEFEEMFKFKNILLKKAKHFEKEVHTLNVKNFPSTQICHICGYRNKELRNAPTKRKWICQYCGTKHDRDINAAINVLRKGMEEHFSKS